MEDTLTIFDNVTEWDFEKYASVILYLHTYYESYMTLPEKMKLADVASGEYCQVPVSVELLKKMEFEETLDEFFGEAEVMQGDMALDADMPLLKVVREEPGLMLYIDPLLMQVMAELPELDENELEDVDEDIDE